MRDIANTLKRGDFVVDLGAHIGLVSLEFAYRADRVFAFEPNPETFRKLCRNADLNSRIVPINKAVSDVTGSAPLYFAASERPGKCTEGSTLLAEKANVQGGLAVEVETIRFATFVDELRRDVRLVKMDIEGAEYRVIADLIETPAIGRIGKLWVETHEDRIPALVPERARVEARIAALGLADRFDFGWP